ncbi:MAG: TonB-dependent receptor, partial [Treponema sp.]|nr:TonB-dependent receptor [Treponema sp.]
MRNKYLDLIILFVFFAAIPCFAQNSGTANAPAETEKEGPENAESDYDDYDDYDDYADFGSDSGITVNAAPETTQQMRVLEKEDIEKHHAPDLASLLEEALDMSITRYGAYGSQTEMNLRGFDTERIAILVDGIPANSPRSGEFDVSQIDLNNVERIEVIYGGSDTKYNVSGALGGVINIITVKKQKPGLNFGGTVANTGYTPGKYNLRHARGEIGDPHPEDLIDMQTLSLFAGYGAEQFSWKASAFGNLAGNHYLYQDDYGFARRKTSGEVWDIGGDVALVWDLPMAATLLSDTKTYYANKNYPVTPNSTGYATAKDFSITENLMLNAPAAFRDDLGTEGSLTWQYSNTNYGVDIKNFDHYITAINRWGWFPSEKLTLRSGIDWRFLYIDSRSIGETNPVKTGNQGGLYVTAEWYPVKTLMLIASLKGATDTKQSVVIPKAGLLWKASPVFSLKNNYFRSFKFPDFDDLYYRSLDSVFVGNPDLKPEDGFGADLT